LFILLHLIVKILVMEIKCTCESLENLMELIIAKSPMEKT